jgi:uncharacterized protein YoxC
MQDNELLQAISDMMDKKFDEKLTPINTRLEKLEADTSALKAGQNRIIEKQRELRQDIKKLDDKVTNTYDLALDAWGTSTENRNWLENDKLKAQ